MRSAEQSGHDAFAPPLLRRVGALVLSAMLQAACPALAQDEPGKRWEAGAYSFSDEMGGFRITGISGTGTSSDPIVIEEELDTASPVTLVIRTVRPIRPFDYSGLYANGFMHIRLDILNNSRLPWVEFGFELQEQLHKPSTFGDGLSFDQRRTETDNIGSTSFAQYSRDFEPFDQLLFKDGKVDQGTAAEFHFLISDFTPRWEFYLVQDPRIPSS